MIMPALTCIDNACVAGVVWIPDMVASFLAWWMPLNLLSYLVLFLFVSAVTYGQGKWDPKMYSLTILLLMTVWFWPKVALALISVVASKIGKRTAQWRASK